MILDTHLMKDKWEKIKGISGVLSATLIIVTSILPQAQAFESLTTTTISDDMYQVFDTNSGTSKICTVIGSGPTRTVICR